MLKANFIKLFTKLVVGFPQLEQGNPTRWLRYVIPRNNDKPLFNFWLIVDKTTTIYSFVLKTEKALIFDIMKQLKYIIREFIQARLAQSVEHKALNLVVTYQKIKIEEADWYSLLPRKPRSKIWKRSQFHHLEDVHTCPIWICFRMCPFEFTHIPN